jgi:hypothetical protein
MGRSIRARCARGHRKTDVEFDRLAVARCRHMICRMSSKPFNRRFADTPSIVFVRRALIVLVAAHVPLALWSGYRAIVQVQRLELRAPGRALRDGSRIRVDVVSSGRTTVDVRLEMIQGARVETLGVRRVQTSGNPAYDPRFRRASMAVVLTPPEVRQLAVELLPQPGP